MEDTYKPIAESQNAGGPVFWRQWYAFFYVYTRVFSTADSGKDRLTAGWPQEVERVVDRCFEQLSAGHTNENCAVELASALNNADMTLKSAPTRPVIDEVFTSPGTANASSLVGAVNKCDNRVLPGNLLALKQAIDQEWEKVEQMTCDEFLNCAGNYNGMASDWYDQNKDKTHMMGPVRSCIYIINGQEVKIN